MREDRRLISLSVPVVRDYKNPGESWGFACTYCNKCGRWDERKGEKNERRQEHDK